MQWESNKVYSLLSAYLNIGYDSIPKVRNSERSNATAESGTNTTIQVSPVDYCNEAVGHFDASLKR